MDDFSSTLETWGSNEFQDCLKKAIEELPPDTLPLETGLSQGGRIDDSNITATILNSSEKETTIQSKAGIFFTEVVGGCNCNDDPFETNAYCEIIIQIDKTTGEATYTATSGE